MNTGPAAQPLAGRQRVLVVTLQVVLGLVAGLAAAAVVLPDDVGRRAAAVTIALLVAVPVVRVGWLTIRWLRRGDIRFAAVGLLLIAVLGVAAFAR